MSFVREKRKFRVPKKKPKERKPLPDFFEVIKEAAGWMSQTNIRLKKLKNYLQYLDNNLESYSFLLELKYLKKTIDEIFEMFKKQEETLSKRALKHPLFSQTQGSGSNA